MSRSYAILGAGLMGRMMAYALAQGGARVEMFERSGPDQSNRLHGLQPRCLLL